MGAGLGLLFNGAIIPGQFILALCTYTGFSGIIKAAHKDSTDNMFRLTINSKDYKQPRVSAAITYFG